ncbi:MAG: hypothetical protein IJU45_03025 [Clostridia bacterium]|nr:hypothetical protein [Clostridia bacterium]
MLTWAFLALGIIFMVIFLIKRDCNSSLSAVIFKICASMMFVVTGAVSLFYTKGDLRYGILFVIGLAFGMLGDIWLDFKWIYKDDNRYFMYGGFIFFLIGHLCYIPAIIMVNDLPLKTLLFCFIFPVIMAVGVHLAAKPMKLDMTGYRVICSVYGAAVGMTVSTSVAAAFADGREISQIILAVGSVLFLLSDLILCSTYFGEGKTTRPYIFVNHLLYYLAQFAFAMSIYFLE